MTAGMISGCAGLKSLIRLPGSDTRAPSEQAGPVSEEKALPSPAVQANDRDVPAPIAGPPEKQPESPITAFRDLAAESPPDFAYRDAILTEDVTWQGKVIIEGVVTVAPQATLTVGPGTVVRFGGGDTNSGKYPVLLVQGRLVINGSKERPVTLTSRFADSRKGYWQGVVLLGTEKKNLLENCRVEGAEVGLDASFSSVTLVNVTFAGCTSGIRLQDALVTAAGGGAVGCDTGMAIYDSEAELRDLYVSGNRSGIVAEDSAIYFAGGTTAGNTFIGMKATNCRVKIAASRFSVNGSGLSLVSSQGSVSGCRLTGNEEYGISLSGSRVKVFGNEIAQNGKTGMKVDDGKGAAWGNLFDGNGAFDLANTGNEEFRAMGNWWGGATAAEAGKRIFDRRIENGRRRVLFTPVMETRPTLAP